MQSSYQSSILPGTRLDPELAARLMREGLPHRFAGGAIVQQQGDDGDGFWLIESGTVGICRFGEDGAVTVFGILGPGDLFGELAYFAQLSRQVDAVAQSDARLIRIGAPLIERMLDEEPAFARALLKSLAHQLRAVLLQIDRDRRRPAAERIALMLADLAGRDGPELRLTQQSLGEVVGISRITAGKVLSEMQEAGAITLGYRRITVRNLAMLQHWVQR